MAIADQINNAEFSDITFIVEGKPFYAHKVIVCQLSEKFRTMLRAGLSESKNVQGCEVKIDGVSYQFFFEIMKYLYTGKFEVLQQMNGPLALPKVVEYLRIADKEFLEDVKILCEHKLISMCNLESFQTICEAADLYNANRLKEYCAWFLRINPDAFTASKFESSFSDLSILGGKQTASKQELGKMNWDDSKAEEKQ
jgi:hypothetical protein